jgi:hypothetical protein
MIAMLGLTVLLSAQMSPEEIARLEGELFDSLLVVTTEEAATDLQVPQLRIIYSPKAGDVTVLRFAERKGRPYLAVKIVCNRETACKEFSFLRKDERALTPDEWKEMRDLTPPVLRSRVVPDPGKSSGTWLVENVTAGKRDLVVKGTLDYPNFRDFVCRAYAMAKLKALPAECAVQAAPR